MQGNSCSQITVPLAELNGAAFRICPRSRGGARWIVVAVARHPALEIAAISERRCDERLAGEKHETSVGFERDPPSSAGNDLPLSASEL